MHRLTAKGWSLAAIATLFAAGSVAATPDPTYEVSLCAWGHESDGGAFQEATSLILNADPNYQYKLTATLGAHPDPATGCETCSGAECSNCCCSQEHTIEVPEGGGAPTCEYHCAWGRCGLEPFCNQPEVGDVRIVAYRAAGVHNPHAWVYLRNPIEFVPLAEPLDPEGTCVPPTCSGPVCLRAMPACPEEFECEGTGCQPGTNCYDEDTGNEECRLPKGLAYSCSGGQTVHTRRCPCSGGAVCSVYDQHLVCE